MDIYTDPRIPFNLGVWARGHKFNVIAVQMTRHLQSITKIDGQIAALQRSKDAEQAALDTTLERARQELEGSKRGY